MKRRYVLTEAEKYFNKTQPNGDESELEEFMKNVKTRIEQFSVNYPQNELIIMRGDESPTDTSKFISASPPSGLSLYCVVCRD